MNKASATPPAAEGQCPCGSGRQRSDCCGPLLDGGLGADTAEALMRSRYVAYVECNEDYLRDSWHPGFRPRRIRFDSKQQWLGLRIKAVEDGGVDHASGTVEFVARYKRRGRGYRLHEISRFSRIEGRWYYCDGDIIER